MFFWIKKVTDQFDTKASLQASYVNIPPLHKIDNLNPDNRKKCSFPKEYLSKRTSRFTPPKLQASMTVEASLVFSLFLFFLVNVFSLIFLFIQYGEGIKELHQQGKELAVYAYAGKAMEGTDGLIRLKRTEAVKSPFSLMAMPECKMIVQCVIKPWTGYEMEAGDSPGQEETIVYMAEYGEVYHKSRHCTHLALSVRVAAFSHLAEMRNQSGGRYTPCEYCKDQGSFGVAYVAEQGNRYHFSLGCQGLKRTVKGIYLSQISGVPACSKCR